MSEELGKIELVSFGTGGYQDAMIGVTFSLSGKSGWGVCDFWGHWNTERTEGTKWSEADRENHLGKMVMRISKLLADAKVSSIDRLQGIPVRVYFENGRLSRWEVLKEVL